VICLSFTIYYHLLLLPSQIHLLGSIPPDAYFYTHFTHTIELFSLHLYLLLLFIGAPLFLTSLFIWAMPIHPSGHNSKVDLLWEKNPSRPPFPYPSSSVFLILIKLYSHSALFSSVFLMGFISSTVEVNALSIVSQVPLLLSFL
jgi:hypothetical protein